MNKKYLISSILVVIVALALGYYFYVPSSVRACNEALSRNWEQGTQCVRELGDTIKSANSCDKLIEPRTSDQEDVRTLCKSLLALQQGSIDACKDIESESVRNSCITTIAKEKKDANICDEVTDREGAPGFRDKDICLAYVADEPEECDRINGAESKATCLGIVARDHEDIELCERIPETSEQSRRIKFSCIFDFALKDGNASLCARIDDATMQQQCRTSLGR